MRLEGGWERDGGGVEGRVVSRRMEGLGGTYSSRRNGLVLLEREDPRRRVYRRKGRWLWRSRAGWGQVYGELLARLERVI